MLIDKISRTNSNSRIQAVLQGYDRKILTEKNVESLLGIDLSTGALAEKSILRVVDKVSLIQFLFQMNDKELISNEVIKKSIFGIGE